MDNEANQSNGNQACMAATDIDNMGVTNYIWSDMVYKLESSYIHMCETMCEHANYRKSKLYHREHKIRKSPMKIHDMIRRKIVYTYRVKVAISEWDEYGQTIQHISNISNKEM